MTAHCIGDGALDVLFESYRRVNANHPIKNRRWSAIHGDFTDEAMMKWMAENGVMNIAQIAWFYKDGDILSKILTERAVKSFYPFKTMENLGSWPSGKRPHGEMELPGVGEPLQPLAFHVRPGDPSDRAGGSALS